MNIFNPMKAIKTQPGLKITLLMNYRLLCVLTLKWAWLCVSKEWTYTLLTSKQLTLIEVLKPDNTGAGSLLLFVLGLLIVIKAIKKSYAEGYPMAIFNKRKFVPPENANSHTLTDITLAVCVQ